MFCYCVSEGKSLYVYEISESQWEPAQNEWVEEGEEVIFVGEDQF